LPFSDVRLPPTPSGKRDFKEGEDVEVGFITSKSDTIAYCYGVI